MRKPIIAGNWEMNRVLSEAQGPVEAVESTVPSNDVVDAVIGSPTLFLVPLAWNLEDSEVKSAAQSYYWENAGAFTGENSPTATADLSVDYVIIGYSGCREYFHEIDEDISKKAKAIFTNGMTPISCCGETLGTYEAGETVGWIKDQTTKGLVGSSNEQVASMVIAYGPIWVIGTDKSADADTAGEICGVVRLTVEKLHGKEVSEAVRIQYGGSVKLGNIVEYVAKENVDGALVGGVSLEADSFLALLDAVK